MIVKTNKCLSVKAEQYEGLQQHKNIFNAKCYTNNLKPTNYPDTATQTESKSELKHNP